MQGGKIYVENGEVKASLALPIAGLMTDENPNTVIKKMEALKENAQVKEGIDPYMNLSFVSLAVIGDVRLLPCGPFNVNRGGIIPPEELEQRYKEQEEGKKVGVTQSDDEDVR